jgi:hypothetical protein
MFLPAMRARTCARGAYAATKRSRYQGCCVGRWSGLLLLQWALAYTTVKLAQHSFSFGVRADEMGVKVFRAVSSIDFTAGQLLNTEMCTYTASQ